MVKYLIETKETGKHLIQSSTEEKAQIKINMFAKYETVINVVRVLAIV